MKKKLIVSNKNSKSLSRDRGYQAALKMFKTHSKLMQVLKNK